MARLLLTVQDLVDQVRNQVDEQDQDAVSLEGDILPVLNRAQDYAYNILARKYQEPLLTYTQLTLTSGQEYDIPEDAFEDRIEKIEIHPHERAHLGLMLIGYHLDKSLGPG